MTAGRTLTDGTRPTRTDPATRTDPDLTLSPRCASGGGVKGHARNIMTERVTAVSPTTPIIAIAATLVAEKIGGVPVVDRHDAIVGYVSEVDVVQALLRDHPEHTDAREIMSHPVATIDEFATAEEVIDLLRRQQIHHLPVVRAGKLVGIISPADVLRFYLDRARHTPPEPA